MGNIVKEKDAMIDKLRAELTQATVSFKVLNLYAMQAREKELKNMI